MVYITVTVGLASIMVSMPDSTLAIQGKEQALELAKAFAQEQPIVNATYLYNSGQVVLGNNIMHPIILIPNEGHHGGVANDMTTNTTIGESVADDQSTLTSDEKTTPDTNEKEGLEQMLPGRASYRMSHTLHGLKAPYL